MISDVLTVSLLIRGSGVQVPAPSLLLFLGDSVSRTCWLDYREGVIQTTAPKAAPTPAVMAMASAPQNVTRSAGFIQGAPPA